MKPKIVIVGAGGHAKIVCDLILKLNTYELVGFVDIAINAHSNQPLDANFYLDYKIIATQNSLSELENKCEFFIVAIGDNIKRKLYFIELGEILKPVSLIHPTAIISTSAKIGIGTVVLANSIVNSNSVINENCIINSNVVIDNDCNIDSHVYLKMGTLVGNNSHIQQQFTSEMGQTILPFSKLG